MRVLVLMCVLFLSGCNLVTGLSDGKTVPAPDVKPEPSIVFTEQDYWNQLAKNVDADVFLNSDDLCSAIDKLVKTGELKDVTRIVEIRKTRVEPITGEAKTKIVGALKGS